MARNHISSPEQRAKKCAAQRERYARDGEEARRRSREQGMKLRAVRIPMINAIKLERGCIDCGYRGHPAALHFDHRDPATKSFTIAKQITANIDRLMAEVAKCDVRCANCHAIRSVEEGHLGRPRIVDGETFVPEPEMLLFEESA